MKKNIILLILLFILSGCSSQYNLKVTSDGLEETINITIDKSMIDRESLFDGKDEIEPDDQITPFIKNDSYPLINSTSKKYIKEVTEDSNTYYIKMNYTFKPEEYKNSVALNSCFEHSEYKNEKDYYEFKLSGKFYCLYGDSTEINVNTPNIVKENNAENISGDTYTWIINDSNSGNVNISMRILKKTKVSNYITFAFLGVLLLLVVGGAFIIIKRLSHRKNINEI